MKPTTLVFPIDDQHRVLLGMKKRGFGAHKYNGFGGKMQHGESFRQCASREMYEESGILVKPELLECVALFDFQFPYQDDLSHVGYIYFAYVKDVVPIESDEMEPHWFAIDDIPYDAMWEGDRTWVPMILDGKRVKGVITFGSDNSTVESMALTEVETVLESEHLARIDLYINDVAEDV